MRYKREVLSGEEQYYIETPGSQKNCQRINITSLKCSGAKKHHYRERNITPLIQAKSRRGKVFSVASVTLPKMQTLGSLIDHKMPSQMDVTPCSVWDWM